MPRTSRQAPGGQVYHVFNRAVGRIEFLRGKEDLDAFHRIMIEAHKKFPLRILAYCLMPNHWHFVVYPREDDEVTNFFRWLTHTHAMRWRTSHHKIGFGPLYQGRFKSFVVQRDEACLEVCRYVERNARSADLVSRAEDWQYGSLATRENGPDELRALLSDWPIDRPRNWSSLVNAVITDRERARFLVSLRRGRPLGSEKWMAQTVAAMNLQHTIRDRGRPAKIVAEEK